MSGREVAEVGKALGAGSEGVAYPALGANGFGALKIHDPTAPLYSDKFIDGKRKFVGHDNPNLARIDYELSPRKIKGKNAPMFMHEFVRGNDLDPWNAFHLRKAKEFEHAVGGNRAVRNGHAPIDVGPHNLKITPRGQFKAVDFIGAPVDQLIPEGPRAGALSLGFKKKMNAPFFEGLKVNFGPTGHRVGRTPDEYHEFILRQGLGKAQQVKKDRSPAGILAALGGKKGAPAARPAAPAAPAPRFPDAEAFRARVNALIARAKGVAPAPAAPAAPAARAAVPAPAARAPGARAAAAARAAAPKAPGARAAAEVFRPAGKGGGGGSSARGGGLPLKLLLGAGLLGAGALGYNAYKAHLNAQRQNEERP
jgi:hypothetical protein